MIRRKKNEIKASDYNKELGCKWNFTRPNVENPIIIGSHVHGPRSAKIIIALIIGCLEGKG
jgi:hypothetical protein